jgi:translation initiation factor IF-3
VQTQFLANVNNLGCFARFKGRKKKKKATKNKVVNEMMKKVSLFIYVGEDPTNWTFTYTKLMCLLMVKKNKPLIFILKLKIYIYFKTKTYTS